MRSIVVFLLALMAVSAGAATVPIPDGGYHVVLGPGDETDFNQLHMICGRDQVTVTFGEDKAKDRASEAFGRGPREAAFADCPLAGGTSVRVKAGYDGPIMPYGECGADPEKHLSVWIGHRKVLSEKAYTAFCSDYFMKSLVVDAKGAVLCTLGKGDDTFRHDFADLPDKGECTRVDAASAPEDKIEFGPNVMPGTFKAVGREPALCQMMIRPEWPSDVAVPKRFRRPDWKDVPRHDNPIDETKLGFNATSLAEGGTQVARFDLENSGRVTDVYEQDQGNHWFDGSALAEARQGILDVPFDAHDWDRSQKSGIYAYVYDHVTVFFDRGRTYLLLDPANPVLDPRIVTLRGGRQTEVCRLMRQQENF